MQKKFSKVNSFAKIYAPLKMNCSSKVRSIIFPRVVSSFRRVKTFSDTFTQNFTESQFVCARSKAFSFSHHAGNQRWYYDANTSMKLEKKSGI